MKITDILSVTHLLIPILGLLNNLVEAVEESEPEVFLPPRNFNPHPYEYGYNPSSRDNPQQIFENQVDPYTHRNTGPVLFPSNPQDSGSPNPYATPLRESHPIDRHPYAGVARKKKYRLGLSRFQKEEQVNPQVYKALAAHGAKVLQIPQAKDLKDARFDPTYANEKKDYAFSYKVVDHLTGDDFSHSQSQNSHATNGEYRVKLPDGRVQIVSYTADKNGYKADVKYAENDEVEYRPAQITKPQYEYNYEDVVRDQTLPVYNENYHSATELPLYPPLNKNHYRNNYVNQHLINVTPKPIYLQDSNTNVELILPNKYQIIPEKDQLFSNIHEQKVSKFIESTLAPFTVDGSKGLGQNVAALSTLAPDLDKFNPIYIDTTAKYKVSLHQYKK